MPSARFTEPLDERSAADAGTDEPAMATTSTTAAVSGRCMKPLWSDDRSHRIHRGWEVQHCKWSRPHQSCGAMVTSPPAGDPIWETRREMRALRLHGRDDLRLDLIDDPTAGDDEVIVSVDACGVCGSDLHFLDGSAHTAHVPITLGHEVAGTITVSADPAWPVGTQVLVAAGGFCGTCRRCREGRPNLCERGG